MSDAEQQVEEQEVLMSIYDGDPAFKQISPTVYQYKYGEDGTPKSFLLEISWGSDYPSELPTINMDTFYNKHIIQAVKDAVVCSIKTEAEQYLGMPMTYTIFEAVKEKQEELLNAQPESLQSVTASLEKVAIASTAQDADTKPKDKKEHLTKAQKRRQWDRSDAKGQRARGWDWVDIVKHLSQTGGKGETGGT